MPELIRPLNIIQPPSVAVIDFDGTLSLLRSGWVEIMLSMMLNVLRPLPGTTELESVLTEFVLDFILNLNGRPTIYQMDYFVNVVRQRGGEPNSAESYTQVFLDELNTQSNQKVESIESGTCTTDEFLIPGTRAMLADLQSRGVKLILASGTPEVHVRREAKILKIDHFFDGEVFGPGQQSRDFSKLAVMKRAITEAGGNGNRLLGIGDGFTEIENAKKLGGIAIGCASDEVHRSGKIEDWKRIRLIKAGADVIIPDYKHWQQLSAMLFP